MIHLTEIPEDFIKMEIKMHLPQIDVINFLQKKGYEVKAFSFVVPATEEFLVSEPAFLVNTFTATKEDEKQSEKTLYLTVFEKEIKEVLNFEPTPDCKHVFEAVLIKDYPGSPEKARCMKCGYEPTIK